jgi:hypothetical protein
MARRPAVLLVGVPLPRQGSGHEATLSASFALPQASVCTQPLSHLWAGDSSFPL